MSSKLYRENRLLKAALVAGIDKQIELADRYLQINGRICSVWLFDSTSMFADSIDIVEEGIRVKYVSRDNNSWPEYTVRQLYHGILSVSLQQAFKSPRSRNLVDALFKKSKYAKRLYFCTDGVYVARC